MMKKKKTLGKMNKESPWYGESWIVLYADDIHFYSPENL